MIVLVFSDLVLVALVAFVFACVGSWLVLRVL